jgi:glutathione S-transferase
MSEFILHHYATSPFSEKVRLVLGMKGLRWRSVTVPAIMPKPDVVALTGGYRRTPFLQIGADVYCDTALIARVLDRVAPAPSLFPYGDRLEGRAMSHFADHVLFNITVPVGFQPNGMMKLFHPEMSAETLAAFGKDRAAMRQGGTVRRGPLNECRANMAQLLPGIEAQLGARPFLLGASASECDFALYHVLWPVWKVPSTRTLLEPYPKTIAFIERMSEFGKAKPAAEISREEALQVAKKSKAAAIQRPEAVDIDGVALGDVVQVMPIDYGLDPVKGELAHCSVDEIVVWRTDPRAGTVAVHFPRLGYQLAKTA